MRTYEKLKLFINEKGFKQSAIAHKTGINAKSLSAMLNGNVELKADALIDICEKGMELPIENFFAFKVPESRKTRSQLQEAKST